MSETDSDLDFQSADEDTESDISNQPPSEVVEIASNVVDSTENMTEISSSNSNKSESANSKPSSSQNKQNDDVEHSGNNEEKPSCDTFTDEDDKGIKEIKSGLSHTSSIVESSKPEKQRVPLRLEKKIQQKTKLPSAEKCDITKDDSRVSEPVYQNVVENKKEESYSWGFSSWGTNLLSTAASSVSTFSSQVSQGIGTVLETVENSLGAPSPEELASALKEKQDEKADVPSEETNEDASSSGILSDMASWTQVFGNTGSKVIMGGLDTLELIGKKTMDILTEGDPGLRKRRTIFSNGISLSEILREAKEKADALGEQTSEEGGIIHYSQAFDDYQGLVHLEALEMLSKQAQVKFQRLLMRHSKDADMKKQLEDIKLIFEDLLNYDEPSGSKEYPEFGSKFRENALKLNIPLNVDNIIMTEERLKNSFSNFEQITDDSSFTPNDIFQSSICTLAEFTAKCIEVFHKIGELILVQSDLGIDIETWASHLINLSDIMCVRVNCFASSYQTALDSSQKHFPNYVNSNGLNITGMVTNIYVEASNSNKYIQDALQMLLPVLQVHLLESLEL